MRPGQNKRMRGRNNNNNNNGGNRKGPNPLARSYESNGPDVKIRGNAHHVAEKYLQLARDAQSSGDPVGAESYLQHAEHYFRLIASYQQTQQIGYNRQAEDAEADGDDEDSGLPDRFASPQAPTPFVPQPQPVQAQPYGGDRQQPSYNGDRNQGGDRQPYGDRNGYGQQRHDRNGQNGQRRPYRDEQRGNDARPSGDGRNGEFRNNNDRRNGYERMQERAQQQERFNNDRAYREQQPDQPRDSYAAEQPRIGDQPRVERSETEPVRAEVPFRPESAPRPVQDEAPGLPSFITTPTRAVSPEASPPLIPAESLSVPAFPGAEDVEPAKFPRRRRRTTRAAAVEDGDAPATQPVDE